MRPHGSDTRPGAASRCHGAAHRLTSVTWALCAACGSPTPPATPPAPAPAPGAVDVSLYLVGDAGAPRPGDPVLAALTRDLAGRDAEAIVAFLGDIVYTRGVPETSDPGYAEAVRRLTQQIDAVLAGGGRAVFVPGNHDWAAGAADGWNAVRREERLVAAHAPDAVLLPGGGCPGPAVLDVGATARLMVLDTQWWLHRAAKPTHPTSSCGADAPGEVTDSIRTVLAATEGRYVIVLAHHPLASGGPHGGHFGVLDHLFPLRAWKRWLWVPLPLIGSVYPLARQAGISDQDLPSDAYGALRDSLVSAYASDPPLVHAAGHEHNLQVLDGPGARFVLVSGVGYYGHTNRVTYTERSRFARAASGFMRVDFLRDGRVRLGVIEVGEGGVDAVREVVEGVEVGEVFSMWLAADSSGRGR